MTPPRPFPFPISIGSDVCQINRIADILRHEYTRNRWARKLFNRLEWPALCERFQRVGGQAEVASDQKLENEDPPIAKDYDNKSWMLPRLSGFSPIFEDENSYRSVIADQRCPLGNLTRHLAGRWAAKEAAVKAHRHRQLSMKNISLVKPTLPPGSFQSGGMRGRQKLIALIDPPSELIAMSPRVATQRGLRGFVPESHGLHKAALMTRDEPRREPQDLEGSGVDKAKHYYRESRIRDSDRQVAEISISHDGDYAIAVCMAFDPLESTFEQKTIFDRGRGVPLHEPEWGDEGWLGLAEPEPEPELEPEGPSFELTKYHMWFKNPLNKPRAPPDSPAFKRSFRKIFDTTNVPPLP